MRTKSNPNTDRVSLEVAQKLRQAGFAYYGPGNQYGFALSDPRNPDHKKFTATMAKIASTRMAGTVAKTASGGQK